jgi:hypothetical protein
MPATSRKVTHSARQATVAQDCRTLAEIGRCDWAIGFGRLSRLSCRSCQPRGKKRIGHTSLCRSRMKPARGRTETDGPPPSGRQTRPPGSFKKQLKTSGLGPNPGASSKRRTCALFVIRASRSAWTERSPFKPRCPNPEPAPTLAGSPSPGQGT